LLLVAGAISDFREFVCFLASLIISKKEKLSLCNSLGLCSCFLLGFFISAVLRGKFIELGYSCLAGIFSLL